MQDGLQASLVLALVIVSWRDGTDRFGFFKVGDHANELGVVEMLHSRVRVLDHLLAILLL